MKSKLSSQRLGPGDLLSYAVQRLLSRLPGADFRRYRLVAVPRSGMPPMPRGFSVRPLTEAEIQGAALDLTDAAIRFRRDQGLVCLGAFRAGELTGVTWLTDKGGYREDEMRLRYQLPPRVAWDTGLFILPGARGGRAFAALWAGTADWLAERGSDWSASRITDYNLASWQAHARMGGREIGRLWAVRIGSWQLSPAAMPRFVRLGKADTPVLPLAHPDGLPRR